MPHEFDFVAAYRNRAYALRLKAESMNAASARSDLLCIAAEYERMAAQAERTKGAVPPAEGTASANAG